MFLYFKVVPPFPQQDRHWATVCSGNPTNEIRGCDKYGCGYYGAPRYYFAPPLKQSWTLFKLLKNYSSEGLGWTRGNIFTTGVMQRQNRLPTLFIKPLCLEAFMTRTKPCLTWLGVENSLDSSGRLDFHVLHRYLASNISVTLQFYLKA